jgi:fatty acid-binding protein DegV
MNVQDYIDLVKSLPGQVVTGYHKTPSDDKGKTLSVEVTAVFTATTSDGEKTYLLATDLTDINKSGRIIAVRVDGFNLRTLDVKPVANFQPIDYSNWWIRPNAAVEARDHFKWMAEVAAEDVELAREVGMKPMAACIIAGAKPKAARKPRAAKTQAPTA